MAICSNERCPTKMLKEQLAIEESKDVIIAILMNPSLPQKIVDEFCATDFFDPEDDSNLIKHLQNRDE